MHWRQFLQSLVDRGLHGVRFIVSDDHAGLRAARKTTFPGVPWQRCRFRLPRNVMAYVPQMAIRREVGGDLRAIFSAGDEEEAKRRLTLMIAKYERTAPKLAAWLEPNVTGGLTVFVLRPAHRRRLRTSNALENLNQEIKRRTRVPTLLPNEASVLRPVSAVRCEIDEGWGPDASTSTCRPSDHRTSRRQPRITPSRHP